MPVKKVAADPITESPVYWFALLEKSVAKGDMETAGKAAAELRRLGVEVRYCPQARHEAEVANA